ncbi:hypothetical protein DXG01_004964 [Tephrocybe rancida]|nr:hypothetical protein DXG01_004964 [Tephrocybe rancida]
MSNATPLRRSKRTKTNKDVTTATKKQTTRRNHGYQNNNIPPSTHTATVDELDDVPTSQPKTTKARSLHPGDVTPAARPTTENELNDVPTTQPESAGAATHRPHPSHVTDNARLATGDELNNVPTTRPESAQVATHRPHPSHVDQPDRDTAKAFLMRSAEHQESEADLASSDIGDLVYPTSEKSPSIAYSFGTPASSHASPIRDINLTSLPIRPQVDAVLRDVVDDLNTINQRNKADLKQIDALGKAAVKLYARAEILRAALRGGRGNRERFEDYLVAFQKAQRSGWTLHEVYYGKYNVVTNDKGQILGDAQGRPQEITTENLGNAKRVRAFYPLEPGSRGPVTIPQRREPASKSKNFKKESKAEGCKRRREDAGDDVIEEGNRYQRRSRSQESSPQETAKSSKSDNDHARYRKRRRVGLEEEDPKGKSKATDADHDRWEKEDTEIGRNFSEFLFDGERRSPEEREELVRLDHAVALQLQNAEAPADLDRKLLGKKNLEHPVVSPPATPRRSSRLR